MKVLIATGIYPPEVGGPATYAYLLAQILPKKGVEVKVLPFRTVRKFPIFIRHIVYFLKVFIFGLRSDIIFTQDPVSTGIPVIFASFFIRKKVILRVAGDYVWEQARQRFGVTDSIDDFQNKKYSFKIELLRYLQKFSVKHADVVVTPSDYFNHLVSGWVKRKRKVITIYNGIDINVHFKRKDKFSTKTIISAGRLVPWKGFDRLIVAMQEMPDWQLLIAGEGPDESRLVKIATDLGVSSRVVFLGQLSREELFEKIYCSHIFALLTTFESFSFQIVEAMFVGVPVIAGNIGNLSEIVDSGTDGILIDPNNVGLFIETVHNLISSPENIEKMIQNAKSKAETFSFDKTAEKLIKLFFDELK